MWKKKKRKERRKGPCCTLSNVTHTKSPFSFFAQPRILFLTLSSFFPLSLTVSQSFSPLPLSRSALSRRRWSSHRHHRRLHLVSLSLSQPSRAPLSLSLSLSCRSSLSWLPVSLRGCPSAVPLCFLSSTLSAVVAGLRFLPSKLTTVLG